MRTLLLTDIHGAQDNLERILEEERFDAVLCAGDLSDAGSFSDYETNLTAILETFDRQRKITKAVPGNMDPEEQCVEKLIEFRMNLHKNIASFERFEAVGFGGGLTPFGTPFEPDEQAIADTVQQLHERMQAETRVAVIHQPPRDTTVDITDGDHVGSQAVRGLLEEADFDLLLTGHIHEARGTDELAGTQILNPGPVQDGYYAVAEIDDGIDLELKER